MHLRKFIIPLMIFIIAGITLTACASQSPTEDPNLKFTQIASTVQAELTRVAGLTPSPTPTLEVTATATLIPATNTPSGSANTPTNTPYPTLNPNTVSNDNSKFMGDITIPDGTAFKPGTRFTKTWRFLNVGKTTWTTDYKLIYFAGNVLGVNDTTEVNLPKEVKPYEDVYINVDFIAPSTLGSYTSKWILYSPDGHMFGENCTLNFSVGTAAATVQYSPTSIPFTTSTPTPQ